MPSGMTVQADVLERDDADAEVERPRGHGAAVAAARTARSPSSGRALG